MTEREKVLKGLDCCSAMSGDECRKCPYSHECQDTDLPYGMSHLAADALALLKEQEDVPVDTKKQVLADRQCEVSPHHYERKGFCPKCHQEVKLILNRNYCGFCGQAVKWDEHIDVNQARMV